MAWVIFQNNKFVIPNFDKLDKDILKKLGFKKTTLREYNTGQVIYRCNFFNLDSRKQFELHKDFMKIKDEVFTISKINKKYYMNSKNN